MLSMSCNAMSCYFVCMQPQKERYESLKPDEPLVGNNYSNHNVNVDIHQLVLHACDFACPVQRPGHSFIATNASTQKLKVSCFDVLYINIYIYTHTKLYLDRFN